MPFRPLLALCCYLLVPTGLSASSSVLDTIVLPVLAQELCFNLPPALSPRVLGDSYRWSDGSTNTTLRIQRAGDYCVTVTSASDTTVDCRVVTAVAFDFSGISIVREGSASRLCPDDELNLRLTGLDTEPGVISFVWSDSSTDTTFSATFPEGAPYFVELTDSCGVQTRVQFAGVMSENCDCAVSFPEIISANNDGTNDRFGAFASCALTDYNLVIFNRWGQEVFQTDNAAERWDGSVDGKPQNFGNYLYLCSFRKDGEADVERAEGQFSLVR